MLALAIVGRALLLLVVVAAAVVVLGISGLVVALYTGVLGVLVLVGGRASLRVRVAGRC